MTAKEDWLKFCRSLAMANPNKAFYKAGGTGKILFNTSFTTILDDSISLKETAIYQNRGTKMAVLNRYYTNPESMNKAKLVLEQIKKANKFGSVAFSTIGKEKKFTKQQHCIQSISIRYIPKQGIEYVVFYRSAEVVKTFMGDMIFIRDYIMPHFGEGKITFFFCNITLSTLYFPLLLIFSDWKLTILKEIQRRDPLFFSYIYRWTNRYLTKEINSFKSARKVQKFMDKKMTMKRKKEIFNALKDCSAF